MEQVVSGCAIIMFVVSQRFQNGLDCEHFVLGWILRFLLLRALGMLGRI